MSSKRDILSTGTRHIFEVQGINRELIEKTLEMRALAYMANAKADLLTDTIFKVDSGKKALAAERADLEKKVQERTKELEDTIKTQRVTEEKLTKIKNELEARVRERTSEIYKLSHAIEQAANIIIITDDIGNIEYTNPSFTQSTGYASEEAIGKNPRILQSGKTPPEVYEELWNTIKSDKKWKGEFCNITKNGELYWENVSISPVKDNKGVITNFIAVKDDITEYKEIENALKKSEMKYHTLVETTSAIPWEFDISAGKFTFIGSKAAELFGYPIDEWLKKDFWPNIIHPDDREDTVKCFLTFTEKSEDHILEYRMMTADNEVIWVYDVVQVIDCDDGIKRLQGIIVNITERKKMEEALLQSEKLRSIGTITAGISHEFNNILAIISGNVQLLEEAYKDDKVLTDTLCTIIKAADDGAEISSKMLKFTKTTLDTKTFVPSDITDLIMHSIDFTKPRWKNEAQARGIDYNMNTESMKRVSSILCNPTELREVFVNIINNALDAMPEGGSISFRTWSNDDTICVSILDTGEGMLEDVKKNVFDPFFSTKGVEGTGLGMSTVYGIVTRHGGKIEVDSEIGKSTTFTLQFPTTNKKASLIDVPDTEQETDVKSLRILVVDDEEDIRNILNQFLSRSGHSVKTVDNGADAIKMTEGEVFDLVLCDLAMPNVFGYDVVKVINGLKKRPKIGIITGWSEDRISDKETKVDFYLRKPFKLSKLIKHINELFDAGSRGL